MGVDDGGVERKLRVGVLRRSTRSDHINRRPGLRNPDRIIDRLPGLRKPSRGTAWRFGHAQRAAPLLEFVIPHLRVRSKPALVANRERNVA